MGQPLLAKEAMEQYQRASDYIKFNTPQSQKSKQAGSVGKLPAQVGLDSKSMKALRIISAIKNPVNTMLAGLETGSLSRDEVLAIKYTYPPLHSAVVSHVAMGIMDMKAEGKFIDASKEVRLGILLDAPVSSKLEKGFIAEVQKAHVANNKPEEANGQQANPQGQALAQVNDYKTPLQTSAT